MGDEIKVRHFEADHFSQFRIRLEEETNQLASLFSNQQISQRGDILGFELEVCIIDQNGEPLGINQRFLDELNNPLVVPELAEFNVEVNGSPVSLQGRVFSRLLDEVTTTWSECARCAEVLNARLVMIGILPTIRPSLLNSNHMSDMVRYYALNDRVMALRDGAPLDIEIEGEDLLTMRHGDVMLESATTSFQIHLQCKPDRAARDFNAALVASGPMVALSANSPSLFGKFLWHETRIPLFEQAVNLGPLYKTRVGFGSDYVNESLMEVFHENRKDHVLLLPYVQSDPVMNFAHLRFQNGTIWRWNRPLIGFDYDGQPHLRIEHRVVPAGPTLMDCVANQAIFIGMVRALSDQYSDLTQTIPFESAQHNFYAAARSGLDAQFQWIDGESKSAQQVILEDLLPQSRAALLEQAIPKEEINLFLDVVEKRVESGQTGAVWQQNWVKRHQGNMNDLTCAYAERQESGQAVHEWDLA